MITYGRDAASPCYLFNVPSVSFSLLLGLVVYVTIIQPRIKGFLRTCLLCRQDPATWEFLKILLVMEDSRLRPDGANRDWNIWTVARKLQNCLPRDGSGIEILFGSIFFLPFFSGALLSRRKKTTRSLRALAQFKCMFNVDCI